MPSINKRNFAKELNEDVLRVLGVHSGQRLDPTALADYGEQHYQSIRDDLANYTSRAKRRRMIELIKRVKFPGTNVPAYVPYYDVFVQCDGEQKQIMFWKHMEAMNRDEMTTAVEIKRRNKDAVNASFQEFLDVANSLWPQHKPYEYGDWSAD